MRYTEEESEIFFMKYVKAADIARALNISKASVSLALNQKPGVSEALRQRVFETKAALEAGTFAPEEPQEEKSREQLGLLIYQSRNGILENLNALLPTAPIVELIEKAATERGYGLQVAVADSENLEASLERLAQNSRLAGLLVMGTDLDQTAYPALRAFARPLLVIDHDLDAGVNCSLLDNYDVAKNSVKFLQEAGAQDIYYLAMNKTIFNFKERRAGFLHEMEKRGPAAERIVPLADTVEEGKTAFRNWLQSHPLPEGLLCESIHTGIAAMQVLLEQGIMPSQDVQLICVDEAEPYLSGGLRMASWKLDHSERMELAADMLDRSIRHPSRFAHKLVSRSVFQPGDTLHRKA